MLKVNNVIRILLIFLFVLNLSSSLFAPLFAIFITQDIAGATLRTVGFLAAIYAITKSLLQIPLARSLDQHRGERDDFLVMVSGSLLATVYTFGLVFAESISHLYALAVFGGIADACLMAAYYAIFSHHTDRTAQGYEWSLLSVGGLTISVAIGGAIGGVLAETLGFRSTFFVAGLLSSLATLLLILLHPYVRNFRRSNKL